MLNLPITEGELTFLAKFVNCAPILLCGRIAHTACGKLIPKHPIRHVPVTKPREICTKCFEGLVSNILQGDKMPHFLYFV